MFMYKKKSIEGMILVLGLLLLNSCATTEVTGEWRDTSYQQPLKKVLVVGMSKSELRRHLFEDTMVKRLEARGVAAVASSTIMSKDEKIDKNTLEPLEKKDNFDALLVTRLVSVRREKYYVPGSYPPYPYYYNFYGYYNSIYPMVYEPGYLAQDTIVSLETNVYETQNEKLIWSIRTETFNPKNANKLVDDLSNVIVKQLAQAGLI